MAVRKNVGVGNEITPKPMIKFFFPLPMRGSRKNYKMLHKSEWRQM